MEINILAEFKQNMQLDQEKTYEYMHSLYKSDLFA